MHAVETSPSLPPDPNRPWWKELNGYHWFVLIVAMLGWLFDTMDQQLFNLARAPAVKELMVGSSIQLEAKTIGGLATMIFMIGWATGGLIFGVLGDRIGRVKTMIMTILLYSAFTGLSAISTGIWDFCFYRFLTGLGVGGEFAVGVALVAEVMPDRARTPALGWLQASSAIGNCIAAGFSMILGELESSGNLFGYSSWRVMFMIGVIPALLVLVIMRRLREPDKWLALKQRQADGEKRGSMRELFRTPELRRNAIVGLLLGFSGVVGLWGIGFFSFDLIREAIRPQFEEPRVVGALLGGGLVDDKLRSWVDGKLTFWVGIASLLQNLGGFFGILCFSMVAQKIGRRPAFLISFLLAMGATAMTFAFLNSLNHIFWMIPILGFCQLTVFGGFAIYFPELFPTRLRSTGISFCYNIGRYIAAAGPLTLGVLTDYVFKQQALEGGKILAFRYAGVTMCAVFFVGIVALLFAPETKGKPLPE